VRLNLAGESHFKVPWCPKTMRFAGHFDAIRPAKNHANMQYIFHNIDERLAYANLAVLLINQQIMNHTDLPTDGQP